MSGTNGQGGPGAGAAVAAARPVVLARYRPGVTGETARTVHVVPLLTNGQAGAVSALCGAVLMLDDIETVAPGEGMPCTMCVLNHVTGHSGRGATRGRPEQRWPGARGRWGRLPRMGLASDPPP